MNKYLGHFFLILILLFSSCSTIRFTSRGEIPISLNQKKNHLKKAQIEGTLEYLFWGKLPIEHVVYLDREFRQKGFNSVSSLKIIERQTTFQFLKMLFSLGLYVERNYVVVGMGKGADDA